MTAREDDILEMLFTATPVDVPRFLAVCSVCGHASVETFAPSSCDACGSLDTPALARVEVLDPRRR